MGKVKMTDNQGSYAVSTDVYSIIYIHVQVHMRASAHRNTNLYKPVTVFTHEA